MGGLRGQGGDCAKRHLDAHRHRLGLRQRQGPGSFRQAAARDPNAKATDWFKLGDVRAEMPKCPTVDAATYRCDYAYHAQMEPLNAVASVSPAGDAAEIWVGTQSQTMAQEATAKALGIARDKVKLNDLLMGGGFGRRGPRDMDFLIDAVLLSKEAGKPVKVMWTREDDVHNGRFRPLSAHHLRAGLRCFRQARRLAPSPGRRPRFAVLRSGALRTRRQEGLHPDARRRPQGLRRPASAGRADLRGHRRAHRAAARHRLHRQQVRDRSPSSTRSRSSAASIR